MIRKPTEERSMSGTNFYINLPVRFVISQKAYEKKEWEDLLKQMELNTKKTHESSEILRKELILIPLNVNSGDELLKKYPAIREALLEVRRQIYFALGLYSNQWSKYSREKINQKKKEFKNLLK